MPEERKNCVRKKSIKNIRKFAIIFSFDLPFFGQLLVSLLDLGESCLSLDAENAVGIVRAGNFQKHKANQQEENVKKLDFHVDE